VVVPAVYLLVFEDKDEGVDMPQQNPTIREEKTL
jgi:hypothetical protein